jgi:ribosomal protein S18 acetylase RimI-like enzyme
MVRHGFLSRLYGCFHPPRKIAAVLLKSVQGFKSFRRIARRLRPGVEVIEAGANDLALMDGFFHLDMKRTPEHNDPDVTVFIARGGAKTIGSVRMGRHPETDFPWSGFWLFSMIVRSRYRGFGIGEMLTRRVIKQALEEGAPELSLLVFSDNLPAVSLYRKMGFERVLSPELEARLEEEEKHTGRRRVVMSRRLIPSL